MGSIFKRAGEKRWTIAWRDETGRKRTLRVGRDYRVATKQLADREASVASRTSGRFDRFEAHRERPIEQHLADFTTFLQARGVTEKHVDQTLTRIRRAVAWFGVDRLDGLEFSRATGFLAHLRAAVHGTRRDRRRTAKTCDDYAAHLRFFGNWLVNDGRLAENPFRLLKNTRTEADQSRRRQALTLEQLGRLTAAAVQRPVQEYARTHARGKPEALEAVARVGRRRALLYWFAGLTGLRANECRQLRWSDLDLDAEVPALNVQAKYAKSRRSARLPLHPELAKMLAAERRERSVEIGRPLRAEDLVLHVPEHIVDRLRRDATWAGLKPVDDEGRVLDFHALRASCATILASHGVAPAVAQRILRHSDPRITMKVYTKLALGELAAGVGAIGALPTTDPSLAPGLTPASAPGIAQAGPAVHGIPTNQEDEPDGSQRLA